MSYKDSERYRKVYSYYRPVPRPTDPGGVSKDYVDEALRAMDWKQSVKYATTGTIVIATNGSAAIDGADLLSDEDRILVKDQASAAENGIYMYYSSTGALTRALDATQDALTCGATVYVESGSVNENRIYTMVTQDPITVGTTAQTWSNILGGGGTPANPSNSVQFNDGGSFGGDANFTFDKTTDTLTVTNISGSLTRLSTGASYILAGPNITVNTNSLGQVEVTGSAGGGGGDVYWSSTTADSIYTSGSVAIRGLDSTVDSPSDIGSDVFFWVSGSLNDGLNRSVFGGDMRISGSLAQGGASNLATGFSSHAEGVGTQAPGGGAHAEGVDTVASGTYSHAEGYITIASGTYSHAEGEGTLSVTSGSHAEGYSTVAGIAALAPYDGGYLGEVSTSVLKLAGDYGDVTGSFPATAPVIFTNFLTYFLGDTVSNSSFDGTYTYITASTSTTLDGPTYVTVSPGFSVPAAYEQPAVSQILTHAHAEGYATHAAGTYSHAEGYESKAIGGISHAEGYQSVTLGLGSHAEGLGSTARGQHSHAEGQGSHAYGTYSHAGGIYTIASGSGQTTVGQYNLRDNAVSLFVVGDGIGDPDVDRHDVFRVNVGRAEVTGTLAVTGSFEVTGSSFLAGDVLEFSGSLLVSGTSRFEGDLMVTGSVFSTLGFSGSLTTLVDGSPYLLAGPNITINTNSLGQVEVTGSAGGGGGDVYWTSTTSNAIFTTGSVAISGGEAGIDAAEDKGADVFFYVSGSINGSGIDDKKAVFGGDVRISGSLSQGDNTTASGVGKYSHAEGANTWAANEGCHAEGSGTFAGGLYTHTEGKDTYSTGNYAHAEGQNTNADGLGSHAEGYSTISYGIGSHTEGSGSRAHGEYSHAEGKDTSARGDYSHVGGLGTIASGSYQHVAGQYNLRDNTASLFVVGDGSGDDNTLRHDVLRVNSGSVEVTGSLLVVGSSFMSGAVYVSGAIDVDGNILDVSGSILLTGTFERQAFNQGTYVKLFTSPLGYSSNLFGQVDSAGERFEFPNRDNNFITVSGPSGSAPGTEGGRLHIRAGDALGAGGNGGNIFIDPGGTGSLGTDPGSIFFGAEKGATLIAFNGGPTLGNLAGADTFFVVSGSIAGTGAADKRAVFNGDVVTSGSYLLSVQSGTLGTEPVVLLVSSSHHLTVFTLGNVTASLPTAAHVGTQLIFKDGTGAASTSPQMVSCSVGILDGASTYTLPAVNYSSVTVVKVEQPDTWVIV